MKLLICGDSFASDWSVKYNDYLGWTNILEQKHSVTNKAQAGCSEYRIYKQLIDENLQNYDCVILSHTSSYRIPVEQHPLLKDDILHSNADLIYSDIKDKNNPKLSGIVDFFENYFHTEYADFVHELIIKEQVTALGSTPTLHLGFYNFNLLSTLKDNFCFESIYRKNTGLINHMDQTGNKKLAKVINTWIQKL